MEKNRTIFLIGKIEINYIIYKIKQKHYGREQES